MSVEDPFTRVRSHLTYQAGLLLDPRVDRDPVNSDTIVYQREVQKRGAASTKVIESWPAPDGSAIRRESLFAGGQIKIVSLYYPLTQGYHPRFNCVGYSVNLGLERVGIGHVRIIRESNHVMYDTANYDQGLFTSLRLGAQGQTEVLVSEGALKFNGCVIDQAGITLPDDQIIRGRLLARENRVALTTEHRRTGIVAEMYFPLEFRLEELGLLILASDVSLLRDQYPAEYGFFYRPTAKQQAGPEVLDERLLAQHLAAQDWRAMCDAIGYWPTSREVGRLVRLWQEVGQGRRSAGSSNLARLQFASWLYKQGRISG